MAIVVGAFGEPFRVSTNGLDMSAFTAFTINFTAPDATTLQKTELTTNAVSAPAVALVNDEFLGNQASSTYLEFITVVADFTIDGTWTGCAFVKDATRGLSTQFDFEFEVLPACV